MANPYKNGSRIKNEMLLPWSYLVLVLCAFVTSSPSPDLPGNELRLHGDMTSDVGEGQTQTPPSECDRETNEMNEALCCELCLKGEGGNACLCDWAPLKRKIFFSMKLKYGKSSNLFLKLPTYKDEPVCKILCRNGPLNHSCWCKDHNVIKAEVAEY